MRMELGPGGIRLQRGTRVPIDGIWDLTVITPLGAHFGRIQLIVRDQDLFCEISGRGSAWLHGEVIGGDLFWMLDTAMGEIEFSASVVGNTMTGEVQVDDFGDITFVGFYAGPSLST